LVAPDLVVDQHGEEVAVLPVGAERLADAVAVGAELVET
jgi:hypothetical protein